MDDFIADLLKRLLAKDGLTQTAIQRATGIPQPRLSLWSRITPEQTLDAARLMVLAKAHGVEGDPELLKHRRPRPISKAKAVAKAKAAKVAKAAKAKTQRVAAAKKRKA